MYSQPIMNSQVLKIYSVGLSALEMKYHKLLLVTNYCWDWAAPSQRADHARWAGTEAGCLMFEWLIINVSELGGTSRQYCKE